MPAFDVIIGGKTYQVEVPDPGACPLIVIVDGQAFAVGIGAAQAPDRDALNPADMHATSSLPPLPAPRPARTPPHPGHTPAQGSGDIRAPMPGTILEVRASVGQAVRAGDVVCVLEAMKMKNPLRAAWDGTVSEVAVQAGQNVGYNQLLMKLA